MADKTVTVAGSGGDYASLNAALAGELAAAPNLTSASYYGGGPGRLIIECENFEDTTAADTGTGWTTSSSYYILIRAKAGSRHSGVWSTSTYRLAPSSGGDALTLQVPNVVVDGIQVLIRDAHDVTGIRISSSNLNVLIKNCILTQAGSTSRTGNTHGAITGPYSAVPNGTITIRNCLIYGYRVAGYQCGSVYTGNKNQVTVENCTIANGADEALYAHWSNEACIARNNLIYNCAARISGTWAAGSNYNATDAASLDYTVTGGGNTHDRLSQTFTFVNAGGGNYGLAANDAGARDVGTDLSGTFTDDITGATRSGTWDIGAFEYIAATVVPRILTHRRDQGMS